MAKFIVTATNIKTKCGSSKPLPIPLTIHARNKTHAVCVYLNTHNITLIMPVLQVYNSTTYAHTITGKYWRVLCLTVTSSK